MDILGIFNAIKTFLREEADTYFGLLFFILAGLGIIRYILGSLLDQPINLVSVGVPLTLAIIIGWALNRRIPIDKGKFTIAIAPLDLHILNANTELTWEQKTDLRKELVDYIFSSLHFNKEKLFLDNYIEVKRLPKRIRINEKTAKNWTKTLGIDLIIWGDAYYDKGMLHFRPRFEFLLEPSNIYYNKFKRILNDLQTFKIKTTESVDNQKTELSQLMHYISFIGMMFQGIRLSHKQEFKKARDCFEKSLTTMHEDAFHNKTLSDIYLATRFFEAQNYHRWGEHLLEENHKTEALELFDKGAHAFFQRANEMDQLHDTDPEAKIEHSILYGIYLLAKEGKKLEALKKLESAKQQFTKENKYLYYLYKGILQKSSSKAKPFFDEALKLSRNKKLTYEKIADYYFAQGKFKESTKFFKERLKLGDTKVYSPSLLEEDSHEKLSIAYAKKANLISSLRERIKAKANHQKNLENKRILSE